MRRARSFSRTITMETTRTEHLWVISVLAAVMLPSVSGSAEVVNGTLGSNITLEFRFDSSRAHTLHHVGLYYGVNQKKAECKASSCPSAFEVKEASATVQYHLSNLSQGDSQEYYAVLLTGEVPIPESNRVHLNVMKESRRTATPSAPPRSSSPPPLSVDRGSSRTLSPSVLIGAVLGPLLLLAVALITGSWCLLRTKEPKGQTEASSIPTVHDRVASASGPPGSSRVGPCEKPGSSDYSLVYSVLDFPKRPAPVLDLSSDTQYATISYLPRENQV